VVFPSSDAIRVFVAASMTRAHLSGKVPEITEPYAARYRHTVFVADKA